MDITNTRVPAVRIPSICSKSTNCCMGVQWHVCNGCAMTRVHSPLWVWACMWGQSQGGALKGFQVCWPPAASWSACWPHVHLAITWDSALSICISIKFTCDPKKTKVTWMVWECTGRARRYARGGRVGQGDSLFSLKSQRGLVLHSYQKRASAGRGPQKDLLGICLSIFSPNIICTTMKYSDDYLAHSELRKSGSSNPPSPDQLAAGPDWQGAAPLPC